MSPRDGGRGALVVVTHNIGLPVALTPNSAWTVDTLREYVLALLASQEKAIFVALTAAEKAVLVAEANADKWRTNANEWRAAMSDRERNFLTRDMFEQSTAQVEAQLREMKGRLDVTEGKAIGTGTLVGYLFTAATLTATIMGLVMKGLG